MKQAELAQVSMLDRWLYWFQHAHQYEHEVLLKHSPETAVQLATGTIMRIAETTEDTTMYDARVVQ